MADRAQCIFARDVNGVSVGSPQQDQRMLYCAEQGGVGRDANVFQSLKLPSFQTSHLPSQSSYSRPRKYSFCTKRHLNQKILLFLEKVFLIQHIDAVKTFRLSLKKFNQNIIGTNYLDDSQSFMTLDIWWLNTYAIVSLLIC